MNSLLARLQPEARLLRALRTDADDFFGDFFHGTGFLPAAGISRAFPALNVWEDEKNVYAECELPGVSLEDIDLSIVGRELRIKGTWTEETPDTATVHRKERVAGAFERALRLGVEVDAAKVTADLSNGVLSITLPKSATALARKVEVKAVER